MYDVDVFVQYQFYFLTNSAEEDGHIDNRSVDDFHGSGSFNSVEQFWYVALSPSTFLDKT
jgi:hypothetical protein